MLHPDITAWQSNPVLETDISVVIPTYNESHRILPTLAAVIAYMSMRHRAFEIIVSDDGSTDDTVELVSRLRLRNVRVLNAPANAGKGAAVRAGCLAARGRRILFTDADLSSPIEELDQLLDRLSPETPIAIASRAAAGAAEFDRSPVRSMLSSVLRMLTRLILGLRMRDTQCGFKLFEAGAAKLLFARQRTDGFSFDLELLWLARRLGLGVAEVPIQWHDAPGSKVQPVRTSLEFLRVLVTIRLMHLGTRFRPDPEELHVALVSPLPPSRTSLNEYGHHLARHLTEVAGTVTVLCERRHTAATIAANPGVEIRPTWTFNQIRTPFRILGELRRSSADVVVFNLHFASLASRRIAAAAALCTPMLARLFGTPSIVVLHNLIETVDLEAAGLSRGRLVDRVTGLAGRLLTKALLRANRVVTTLPRFAEILRESYGAHNVYVAPHGTFEAPLGERPDRDRRRVLTFGKFGTYKRVEPLLDAHRLLLADDEFSDVELVVAGSDNPNAPGYLDRLRDRHENDRNVRFRGYVPEDEISDLFTSADIVAFPYTATTGSSGPLHQAGAYGCAAVLPRIGDFVDVVTDEGFAGEHFDPADPESLADALRRLLADPARLRSCGEQNKRAANALPLSDIARWHLLHLRAVA